MSETKKPSVSVGNIAFALAVIGWLLLPFSNGAVDRLVLYLLFASVLLGLLGAITNKGRRLAIAAIILSGAYFFIAFALHLSAARF
jgi:hypothetical protein